jgi:prepilin-type N-terminal cleavage/methylation domain-containing protein
MNKSKFKGYTLLELVVVMAIIGILATVTVPNMIYQISKSKYKNASSQAEVIYNSAQTIVQKYETIDRSVKDTSSRKLSAGRHTCGNIPGATFTDNSSSELYQKIKSYYKNADSCVWAVVIDCTGSQYKIIAVYYSDSADDNYVGIYPSTTDYDSYVKGNILSKYPYY